MQCTRAVVFAVVALGSIAWRCSRAHAEQFVLTDIEYTHSTATTKDSHYYPALPADIPKNWIAPVDYAHGSVHIVVDVKTKPAGDAPTKLQVCFEGTPSYACTSQSRSYTTTGRVEWDSPFSGFWYESTVDWAQGTKKMPLILKDDMNNKPHGDAKYMPTELHVQVTLVSKGSTFVPPPPPMAGSGGAGGGSMNGGSGGVGAGAGAAGADAGEPAADAGAGDRAPASDAGSNRPAAPGTSGAGGAAGSNAGRGGASGSTTVPEPRAATGGAGASAPASGTSTSGASGSSAGETSGDNSGCRIAGSGAQNGAPWSLIIAPAYLLYRRRRSTRRAHSTFDA